MAPPNSSVCGDREKAGARYLRKYFVPEFRLSPRHAFSHFILTNSFQFVVLLEYPLVLFLTWFRLTTPMLRSPLTLTTMRITRKLTMIHITLMEERIPSGIFMFGTLRKIIAILISYALQVN